MNAPAPPPPKDPRAPPEVQATLAVPATGWSALTSALALIPALFLIAFHVGAGYLSYQKYGNIGWASLDFLFPYLYYPYYAFFLAKEAAPAASVMPAMVGGMKGVGGLMKAVKKMMK